MVNARAVLLQEILEGAERLNLSEPARAQLKQLVRRVGIAHGIAGMAHAEQMDYAGQLLRAGVSRATARDRLMALFRISRRQAYSVIQDFLNCAE